MLSPLQLAQNNRMIRPQVRPAVNSLQGKPQFQGRPIDPAERLDLVERSRMEEARKRPQMTMGPDSLPGGFVEIPAGPYRQGDYEFGTVITKGGKRYGIPRKNQDSPYLHPGMSGWEAHSKRLEFLKQIFLNPSSFQGLKPGLPRPGPGRPSPVRPGPVRPIGGPHLPFTPKKTMPGQQPERQQPGNREEIISKFQEIAKSTGQCPVCGK